MKQPSSMVTTNKNLTISEIKFVLYFLCILFLRDLWRCFLAPFPSSSSPSFPSSCPGVMPSSCFSNSFSYSSASFYQVICSLSCIVLKKIRHFSSYFFTSSLSISIKCLNSSSLFLSTFVATGKIKHNEINSEQDATISKMSKVLFTRLEILPLSLRMASVLDSIEARILFKEFVKMKKTAVSFLLI